MTSLSEQLRRLALPDAGGGEELVKRLSLLFDPRKAATLDRETFYALGVNGFEELCSIDATFRTEFYDVLFSELAKNTERSVLSKGDNKKLDKQIQNFLFRISPYFLMRPTQKCLEWLIYRFQIHHFNIDEILQSFLPYHETKLFVKVVQLLDISHPTNKWCWISPIQKPGVALARATISTHCSKDSAFFYFLCDSVVKAIKVHSALNDASSVLRPVVNFYATIILGTIHNMEKISDEFLAQLIPFLIKGLKSKLTDYKAATYMIICQICTKVTLTEQVVTSLLKSTCKYYAGRLHREFLTTIIVICQSQENFRTLPKLCIQKLCIIRNFLEIIEDFHKTNEIERFYRIFLECLIPATFDQIFNHDSDQGSADLDDDLEDIGTDLREILMSILQNFQMSRKIQEVIVRMLVEEFIKRDTESVSVARIIQQTQRKYPEAFDTVVAELSQKSLSKNTDNSAKRLNKFIHISMETAKYQALPGGDASLVLSLCHPEAAIRISAIENMQSMFQSNADLVESEFVKESIKHRLETDESPAVVLTVLKLIHEYGKTFFYDLDIACSILIKLVLKNRGTSDWDNVSLAALTLLSSDVFSSCTEHTMNLINVILYDVILREICINQESSVYNISIRGSYMEKNSKFLFPIK